MCGIICTFSSNKCSIITDSQVYQRISNRGPDNIKVKCFPIQDKSFTISICASVLWLQGTKLTKQPVENDKGFLLYNGDIFNTEWDNHISDTEQIMQKFNSTKDHSTEEIVKEITKFKGPFSLIYFNRLTNDIIFCRDRIGRNSLLFYMDSEIISISSVLGRQFNCVEISANHIYVLNIETNKLILFNWDSTSSMYHQSYMLSDWFKTVQLLQSLPDEKFYIDDNELLCLTDEENVKEIIDKVASEAVNKLTIMETLLQNNIIKETVTKILRLLDFSVGVRVKKQLQKCKACVMTETFCDHAALGILFSGGLDCTILAYLADKYTPADQSIDLLNVAFSSGNESFDVPDRLTGKQSLQELRKLCPLRKWNFMEINIRKEDLSHYQETTIGDLVYPRQTILDESLGSALWFAARGDDGSFISPCRVLLLGSGADELFGGYTRHRNAFKRQGWMGLQKELLLDWKRISFRNLARDNRVICDHGRQPRMPYLDEDFVDYVMNLNPWYKCYPSEKMGPGLGDKLFLRLVAYQLGLKGIAFLPKRALQFGSKIANKKEKGCDVSKNLVHKVY